MVGVTEEVASQMPAEVQNQMDLKDYILIDSLTFYLALVFRKDFFVLFAFV